MSLIKAGTFSIFSDKTSLLIISDFKPEFHTQKSFLLEFYESWY